MGRIAKCQICKRNLDTDTAYQVVVYDKNNKPKNKYYCDEDEYNAEEERKKKQAEYKDRAYFLICDIIERKEIINTVLWKEWAIWNKVATNEVISQYLEENKDDLKNMISRLDNVEFNRIRYLSAILKNKLGDYKPRVKVKEEVIIPVIQEEHYETKYKNKKRKGFEALEEEFYE